MTSFSHYPGFQFVPGYDPITFGFSVFSGSSSDTVGEDRVPPNLYHVPCAIQDECGVCNGTNACWVSDPFPSSCQSSNLFSFFLREWFDAY